MRNIKEITEDKVLKIIRNHFSFGEKNLLRKQYNELLFERKNYPARIIAQPPFINSINNLQYNDFAIFNWVKNIDVRIEVKSLVKPSDFKNVAYKYYFESFYTPEAVFIMFLVGDGYDKQIINHIRNQTKKDISKVIIIEDYDELDNYFTFINRNIRK